MNEPAPLEKIGRYQVLSRVGKGGMGVLYRGFDPVLDREVAIKLMLADFSDDSEQMRPRFYREARAAARLNHRNIVTIHEFAEENNVPYIVMEFLRGVPLGSRMHTPPPLTIDDKLNVIAQLCDGLAYAHEQGVVHRDVKPDNIFLLDDGSVKLLDFGIAKLTSSTLTRQGDVLGSASYMSPEQVSGGESVDGRADIFSTGVVLYELLAGRRPFVGDTPATVILKILKEDPTPLDQVASDIPADLVAVVMKALAKDPAARFATADALGRALQAVRKTIHPSVSTAQLDETRFASTTVMKALHEDFQAARSGTLPPGGAAASALPSTSSGSPTASVPAPGRSAMPVAAAAVALVAAVGGYLYFRGSGPATPPIAAPMVATAGPDAAPAAPVAVSPVAVSPAATAAPAPSAPPPVPSASVPSAAPAARPASTERGATKGPAETRKPEPMITVSLTGGYPFEVLDGRKSVSAEATSHELKQPAGKSLQLVAPRYFLNQAVKVDGSSPSFEFSVPGLGGLDVRSAQETCDVMIGDRSLGNPPLLVNEIAAGAYKVDLSCGGTVVKSHYATIRPGQTYVAAIR